MSSWHQQNAGLPVLYHATKWTAYNPKGHLSVMRFDTKEDCMKYCNKTGDTPLAPQKL
jgi:hypothetical protein